MKTILDNLARELDTWGPQPSGEVWVDPRLTWLRNQIAALQRLTR